ncbi:MAG: hypothetical protein ACJZ40_01975 [Candidatus Poseidoniaceae archaeon]|tara:strand:+ start:1048 stop:1758 length:711 start_codon:yes stop_codon:yes gene_type:complete
MDLEGEEGVRIRSFVVADRTLLRFTWMVIFCTVVLSMLIHAASGNARDVPFFISESDYPGIERYVFTVGLTLSGLLLCTLSMRLKHAFDVIAKPTYARISLWAGLATGLSLVLLSWFNMYDQIILHSLFAMITFGGGYLWGWSTHSSLLEAPSRGHVVRKSWLKVAGVSLLVMHLALARPVKEYVLDGGIRDGTAIMNMSQNAINIAAPAEYLLFFSLVMMLASFGFDLENRNEKT